MRQLAWLLTFMALGTTFTGCESEYSKTVKKELNTKVIHEDLILGLKLGQTQKEFYDHCWQLNKQQLISQGSGNEFARHIMQLDSTAQNPETVEMLFYGIFDTEKVMRGMHMKFSYLKWALWNKNYQSDVLVQELQNKYIKEYSGNPFIKITIKEGVNAYVKVDGNREILIYPTSQKDVTVKMRDLRYSRKEKQSVANSDQNS